MSAARRATAARSPIASAIAVRLNVAPEDGIGALGRSVESTATMARERRFDYPASELPLQHGPASAITAAANTARRS